jgi:YqjK-like protein
MRSDEAKLAARLDELLRHSAELRSRITDDASAISSRLRGVDRATSFLRSGGGRAIIAGGLVLLMFMGPGRLLKVASRSAFAWSLVRRSLPRVLALARGRHRA